MIIDSLYNFLAIDFTLMVELIIYWIVHTCSIDCLKRTLIVDPTILLVSIAECSTSIPLELDRYIC